MSDFTFRPAVREHVFTLVGLAGGTGSGKTYTAMRLAAGISDGAPFAVIDTENDRALHYADFFRFDHGNLRPPFRPARYLQAIEAAAAAGYPAIVVDSMSHEQEGEGGLNEWHDEELERLIRGDEGRREALNMKAWIAPKVEHRKMLQRLLQVKAHVILCFRASDQIEMAKDAQGRTVVRPKQSLVGFNGLVPIAEKRLPYELTAFFMLLQDRPGVPYPIKLQEQHKPLFPEGQPITEEHGRRLAEWARGGRATTESVWLARIETATTTAQLRDYAAQLRRVQAGFPESARSIINAAYSERMTALKSQEGSAS